MSILNFLVYFKNLRFGQTQTPTHPQNPNVQNPNVFGGSPFKMEVMTEIDKIKT